MFSTLLGTKCILTGGITLETTAIKEKYAKLKEKWDSQAKNRKIMVISGIAVAIFAVAFFAYTITKKDYSVLFSNLDQSEAGEVYNKLKDEGVNVKIQNSNTILVEKNKVDEIRLNLSAQGYPKSGLNYDIFENSSNFGATDADKQVYLKFQLEQNITQTIKRLDKISDATVMITLSQDSQFALSGQGNTPASASIVLNIANGQTISATEATSIRNLVKSSVPNLQPENITIVDQNMKMYNDDSNEDDLGLSSDRLTLVKQTQTNLEEQVLKLLAPVFGQNNIKTSVNVVLDFDTKVTSTVKFEPPIEGENTGIIVSLKELEERINGGTTQEGSVGVDANGGVTTYPEITETDDGQYYKTTRELNAEVNETKEQIESAKGQIKQLSISVVIDGEDDIDAMLPQVTDLIAKAIGVEEDNISVARMAFKANEELEASKQQELETINRINRNKMIRNIVLGVLALLLVVAVYLLFAKKKKQQKLLEEQKSMQEQSTFNNTVDVFADEDINIDDLAKKDSENHTKITKLVENSPEAVAQLLRNWLDDEYGR